MTVRSTGAPLEQVCLQPGVWLVEGRRVTRVNHREWVITSDGRPEGHVPSLGAARDRIREELNR